LKNPNSHPPHLDLLGAVGDAVAAVVAIDVLERLVARVADRAVHLHRAIRGLADETVRAVVAHRDLVRDLSRYVGLRHLVHLPRGLVDQRAPRGEGHFTDEQSDVGRSLTDDRRKDAKNEAPKGQGDRRDRRP